MSLKSESQLVSQLVLHLGTAHIAPLGMFAKKKKNAAKVTAQTAPPLMPPAVSLEGAFSGFVAYQWLITVDI